MGRCLELEKNFMNKTKITVETYNKIAPDFEKMYCKKIYYQKYLDRFLSYLQKNQAILDAGCGTGHVARYVKEKGYVVEGIDLSKEMIKIAKSKSKDIKFEIEDIRKARYSPDSFDAIMYLFSLNHLNNNEFEEIICTSLKIIKKGGFIFLGLPEGTGEKMEDEYLKLGRKMYFNYFEKKYVKLILKKYNFNIIKINNKFLKEEKRNEFYVIAKNI